MSVLLAVRWIHPVDGGVYRIFFIGGANLAPKILITFFSTIILLNVTQ